MALPRARFSAPPREGSILHKQKILKINFEDLNQEGMNTLVYIACKGKSYLLQSIKSVPFLLRFSDSASRI
jgi:hypothetical protein